MKKLFSILAAVSVLFLLSRCQKEELNAPVQEQEPAVNVQDMGDALGIDPYGIALSLMEASEWPVEREVAANAIATRGPGVHGYNREVIAGDIAHYWFTVRFGSNPYNRVRLHRVVKETAPNRPIKTPRALFYQHGDAKDFVGMMLPGLNSPTTPNDFGMAVYLAEHNVDVWGIDQAWNLVPDDVTDFEFMKNWGLDKQQMDLRRGISIARLARYLTGSRLDKMHLAGYSSGVITGYAALNAEALAGPRALIKGFIPIDLMIKTDDQGMLDVFISEYNRTKELLDNGEYQDFIPFRLLGQLARNQPDEDSPVIPGFTNLQAALFFGAGPIFGETHAHYLAGVWDNDLPVDLQFLTQEQWFDFMEAAPLYEPAQFINDYSVFVTEIMDSPFDDHFADITVPILNLGAYGGIGYLSEYGYGRLGSEDVTHHIIQLNPDDEGLTDFAHIDIFLAENAEELAWRPLLDWIRAH